MSELSDEKSHYRVVLACNGFPVYSGPRAAIDVTQEFTKRPWHDRVVCTWNGHDLILQSENDFDPEGIALIDEFSDAIAASIGDGFDGNIRVLSTARF